MKVFILFLAILAPLSAEMTPQRVLQMLKAGNKRFANEKSVCPDRSKERRLETERHQEPFAAILACADSRVAPEIIFDLGVGDLFVVRVAGNVVGPVEMDSMEYSTKYLHAKLVVVMGHENCGAIKAVLAGTTEDIEAVAELIQPAVDQTKDQSSDRLLNTTKANVARAVKQLKESPVHQKLIEQKKLEVVGAYYNFQTGLVEFL